MDTPGNPFLQLKLLAARSKDARLTILLTGSSTIYTSSMTNPLHNTRIMHVDTGKQGILEIVIWDRTINDLPCRIITLPELGNISYDTALTPTCIAAIQAAINPIHCIWFVARLHETILHDYERNVIKWVTAILGEHAWNYAILVLTHSNTIKDTWKRADIMKKRSESMRVEIAEYTGWDIAANITSVPVTALDDIILDGKKWVPELYQQIMRHSNLREIMPPASTNPSSKFLAATPKSSPAETGYQPQEVVQSQKNRLSYRWLSYTGCYLSCALVGTLCMSLWGLEGLAISLVVNLLFWSFLGWLRMVTHSEDLLV
jgi:AIG1 family